MKIRFFCMIALVLSAAACTDGSLYDDTQTAVHAVPGFDGTPATVLKTA